MPNLPRKQYDRLPKKKKEKIWDLFRLLQQWDLARNLLEMENAIAYNKQIDSILSDPKLPEKYKKFLRKHRNTEQVKQAIISGKLIFHEKGVELDGLKFPINILKYDDVKNIPWLELDSNVYQKGNSAYFTFDAVSPLMRTFGNKVTTKYHRKQAADVFKWSYEILGKVLGYDNAGLRNPNGKIVAAGDLCFILPDYGHLSAGHTYLVVFGADGYGWMELYCNEAASMVVLQD